VTGLCGRGGFEVDLAWANGKVVTLGVKSNLGNRCRIRAGSPLKMKGLFGPSVKSTEPDVIEFETKAGKTYTFAGK
jgi:alpha-L-fucosidase 2